MNVHPVLRGITEASQLQLPRAEPDEQPIESSHLAIVVELPGEIGEACFPRVCYPVALRSRGQLRSPRSAGGAAAAMTVSSGIPQPSSRLVSLWPNCDVLPPAEATVQGVALEPTILSYPTDRLGEVIAWPSPAAPASLNPAKFRIRCSRSK